MRRLILTIAACAALAGCEKPKPITATATAPAVDPACPAGYTQLGSMQPRRTFPNGSLRPEETPHGDSGQATISMVFPQGILWCSKAK